MLFGDNKLINKTEENAGGSNGVVRRRSVYNDDGKRKKRGKKIGKGEA